VNHTRNKTAAFALVSLSCLGGCFELPPWSPKQPNVVSLDPQDWYFFHCDDMPHHPSHDPAGAWSFNFPQPDGHVNYLETPFNATEVLHNVSITFKIESTDPQYKVIDPTDHLAATVHLFFEQRNDDLRNPYGRWWASYSKYDLGSQDNILIKFVIPLTPDQWTSVYGERNPEKFNRARKYRLDWYDIWWPILFRTRSRLGWRKRKICTRRSERQLSNSFSSSAAVK
jgi:hypothetical protein